MTDWIHALATDWGHWMRRIEVQSSLIQGTLGRVQDQGAVGAAIRSTYASDVIPVREMPKHIAEFHRAWLDLPDDHQVILFIEYKLRPGVKRKFRLAGKKKDAYYRARGRAKLAVAEQLDSRNGVKTRKN